MDILTGVNSVLPMRTRTSEQSAAGATDLAKSFGQFLNDQVSQLNNQSNEVDQLNNQFVQGKLSDVHQLMIASEKATLGLQLTVQVRNKVVEAYQEIMRMQV
jgi:flagellar hook-basal body complex protein FliE